MTKLEKRISAIERKLYSVIDGVKVRSLNEKISLNGDDIMYTVSLENGKYVSRKIVINSIKTFVLTGYQTPGEIAIAIQNIANNTSNIQTNTQNIQSNVESVQTNTQNISDIITDVINNSNNIYINSGEISVNETTIQDNASDISDNDDDIAINTQNIQNNVTDLTGVHDNLAGLGNLVVGNSGDINSLQQSQLQILDRLADIEFNIEKDRVVSLNESFVNAGVDYTDKYGVSGQISHIDFSGILQTDKDCLIHYNTGDLTCTVYVNKAKQLFSDIESIKINTITMFNLLSIGVDTFTRQPKELNFQVLINDNTIYTDETINGVDYRLYTSTSYGYSSEIGAGVIIGGDMIVKAN